MKAIIIEDENLISKELKSKIKMVAPDIQIIEILSSVKTANRWFMQNAEPDLIFADIQLSDGVSFEIFENYTLTCPIIFTTAYDEYALQAFKVNGVDYLLKPVDKNDLFNAIEKCRARIGKNNVPLNMQELLQIIQHPEEHKKLYKEKFVVHFRNAWVPIQTADIACFLRDQIIYLYTKQGDKYIAGYVTLEEIEELLNPEIFYRANRQCILHIDSIQSIKPHANQKVSVKLKKPLEIEQDISRDKAPAFKKWFDK